jgi:uncharacterized metal-binding protein YceD (DUF177 family)
MKGESFSFSVPVARIASGGKHFSIAPDAGERSAIAETLGIVEVSSLIAEVHVRPVGAEAFAVKGALAAAVVQTDVVTLEPVQQEVSEEIDLMLLPADDIRPKRDAAEQEAVDDRDVYRGGKIDLGAIVVEHLALGLDPYPRSPGVEFPGHIESVEEPESSPFAALANFKPKQQ